MRDRLSAMSLNDTTSLAVVSPRTGMRSDELSLRKRSAIRDADRTGTTLTAHQRRNAGETRAVPGRRWYRTPASWLLASGKEDQV